MKPKPPEVPTGADEAAAPERALRPMPPHDGPFVPLQGPLVPSPIVVTEPAPEMSPAPGLVRAFGSTEATGPTPEDVAALPTVEDLAERFDLVKRDALGKVRVDENGRPRLAFMGAFLFAKEGYAVGQRVAPADFETALDAAKNEPLNGGPPVDSKKARRFW